MDIKCTGRMTISKSDAECLNRLMNKPNAFEISFDAPSGFAESDLKDLKTVRIANSDFKVKSCNLIDGIIVATVIEVTGE